jgi:hypothetical protein
MIADLNTYLTKAIPDTKLTIEKYADAKFEYLVGFSIKRMEGSPLVFFKERLNEQKSKTVDVHVFLSD